jgi:hypothetical protein
MEDINSVFILVHLFFDGASHKEEIESVHLARHDAFWKICYIKQADTMFESKVIVNMRSLNRHARPYV